MTEVKDGFVLILFRVPRGEGNGWNALDSQEDG